MELKLVTKTREEAKELIYRIAERKDCYVLNVEEDYRNDNISYIISFEADIKLSNKTNNLLDGKPTKDLYDDLAEVLE